MTLQFSVDLRNARADQIETVLGTAPLLQIRSGTAPANCAAGDSGTLLAELTLPSDWMAAASAGSKSKSGIWSVSVTANGTAAHFRLKTSGGVCKLQGDVTATGGGGLMEVNTVTFTIGYDVVVTTFTITEGNA